MTAARNVVVLLLMTLAQQTLCDTDVGKHVALAEDLDSSDGFTAGRTLLGSEHGRGRGGNAKANRRQSCKKTKEYTGYNELLWDCGKKAPRCTRQCKNGNCIFTQIVTEKCKCTCTDYNYGCTTVCFTKPIPPPVAAPQCTKTCVKVGKNKLYCYHNCGPDAPVCIKDCKSNNGFYGCKYICNPAPSPSPLPPSPPPPTTSPPPPSPSPPSPSPPSPPPPNPSPPPPSPPPPSPSPPLPSPSPPTPSVTVETPPPQGPKCGFTFKDGKKSKVFCGVNQVCCKEPKTWGGKRKGRKYSRHTKVQPKCADTCSQWCETPVPVTFYLCNGQCAN